MADLEHRAEGRDSGPMGPAPGSAGLSNQNPVDKTSIDRRPSPVSVDDRNRPFDPPPPTAPTPLVASVAGVDKRFGSVDALSNLHIEVPESRITVLLGPNGAGKTTAIRMITGAMAPDTGSVSVFGLDPAGADGEEVRRRCGVVSAKPSLYDRLSGLDNLRYAAELYGLGRGRTTDRTITEAADRFGIADALSQGVGGYSTGMKTRLALARAVLHEPDLLLLDEPTSGLDPESAQQVLAMVREMTADGRTVLMCTHLLLEAEGLADEIVVIQDGTSLVWGDPGALASHYWPRYEVTITAVDGRVLDRARDYAGVEALTRNGTSADLTLDRPERVTEVVAGLVADGADLQAVVPFKPSLEDLYFAIRRDHRGEPIDGSNPVAGPMTGRVGQRPGGRPHDRPDSDNPVDGTTATGDDRLSGAGVAR